MSFTDASCSRRGYGASVSPLTADLFSDESTDGPALTPDGRVVDLENGQALYFSHDKTFSPSNETKLLLKDEHRMRSAVKVAHAACEAEKMFSDEHPGHIFQGGMLERKCSIDGDGVLHDADIINLPPPSPADKCGKSERLKRFHRKQASRKAGNADHVIDVVDNEGTVQGFKKRSMTPLIVRVGDEA